MKRGMKVTRNYGDIPSEVVDEAVRLVKDGKTDTEISKILGISTYYLRKIRIENNLPPSSSNRNYTTDQRNDVIELIRADRTLEEISTETGIPPQTITRWRREENNNGFNLPEILTNEDMINAQIGKALDQGKSYEEISEELDVSMKRISEIHLFILFPDG